MRALTWNGVNDLRVATMPDPEIVSQRDAIIRVTMSSVCGSDLHLLGGYVPAMKPGDIIGHEFMGEVVETGREVRKLKKGDRAVAISILGCGQCEHCRRTDFSCCDNTNPKPLAAEELWGHSPAGIIGYSHMLGGWAGSHANYIRVPFADVNVFPVPEGIPDEKALFVSDACPTGFMGADLAGIEPGDVVAVWGCGPVGLFSVLSAFQFGAHRVIAIDGLPDRLERARLLGAETVNFNEEDPIEAIKELTRGIGPDRAIDAVGVESEMPKQGPAAQSVQGQAQEFAQQVQTIASDAKPQGEQWKPGDAPMLASAWAVKSLAKAGTLGIIGVYPPSDMFFPIGAAMNKNLTINMGNCNHRTYIPKLVEKVAAGTTDPTSVLSNVEPMSDAIEAYKQFDLRRPGWIKVELRPGR